MPASLRLHLAALLLLCLWLIGCGSKGGDEETGENPYVTTPYTLTLPSNLPQNVGVPASNPLTVEGVDLGRKLFYEPRLSRTGTQSCGSCHQQSKAFTDGLTKAIGVDGLPHSRNTMSLTNVLWETTLNWDGAATSLEQQARLPIENPVEMHQLLADGVRKLQQSELYPPLFQKAFGTSTISEENVLKALAQFERTLISANSRYDQYLRKTGTLTPTERQGAALFNNHPGEVGGVFIRGGACHHCHFSETGLFSSPDFFNNGLDVTFQDAGRGGVTGLASERGKFKAPTLRNIALTGPYMHDGRFKTLEEVLDHYNEHVQTTSAFVDPNVLLSNTPNGTHLDLTITEKTQLLAFLRTLTDSAFVTDKKFSDPFKP
ncbi:cytochrome-c peroxidase [Hymenobacter taeanensis]|uniref:Cytochrome-c peroxidase n=1 Tax=Hymenobacter taeanensis TaxID=2735321 RepID=A0A6M6BIE2_9BACT|nr:MULTISPECIES: cytochrome c peroxidase [Hymenobacter]QJX47886.1 cytochrome-c peroxidase [Hymenobacter taeanensis]UOQ82672.1 cytochrome-c peroxidase [Hymenobacter sp. 5414T-23]